jgi:WD40 repeat protein
MNAVKRLFIFFGVAILTACSPSQAILPAGTTQIATTETTPSLVSPTITSLPTVTPVAPTNTRLPTTATPQPNSIPSVTTLPLAANGPWGVVKTDKGIWAFNPDGEGLRQLTQDQIAGDLAISPSGGKVAYLADYNSDDPSSEKVSLRLLSLPDGTIQTISDVMPPMASLVIPTPVSSSGSPTPDLEVASGQIYSALEGGDWSPDGQRLAFVSAHNGLFTNIYVYDLRTGKITRMTDRPHYDYGVKWSPTGGYIFFSEAESFGGGGTSGGSAQVIRADRPEAAPVWGIPASDTTPAFAIISWISPDSLLLESYAQPCGVNQLSNVDIITGKIQTLWQAADWGDCVENIIRDPVSGDLLLNQIRNNSYDLHIALLASNGVKLKDVNTGDLRTYLLRGDYPDNLNLVGSAAAVPASLPGALIPIQSPDGGLWAWLPWWISWFHTGGDGLWIGNAGQPPSLVSSARVDSFSWSPDGKTMFLCASGILYIAHWPDLKPEVFDAAQTPTIIPPLCLNVNWVIH